MPPKNQCHQEPRSLQQSRVNFCMASQCADIPSLMAHRDLFQQRCQAAIGQQGRDGWMTREWIKDVQSIYNINIEVEEDGRCDRDSRVSASAHARDHDMMTHLCCPTSLSEHPYGSVRCQCQHGRRALHREGVGRVREALCTFGRRTVNQTSENNSPNQGTSHT